MMTLRSDGVQFVCETCKKNQFYANPKDQAYDEACEDGWMFTFTPPHALCKECCIGLEYKPKQRSL